MYFEEYGDRKKPTIVFLHCAALVDIYVRLYTLSARYHIVVPHLYGSGYEVYSTFDFHSCVSGVLEILDEIGKERVYLAGHSLGANLALTLLAQQPDRFEKAIISSPMIDPSDQAARQKAHVAGVMYPLLQRRAVARIYSSFLGLDKARAHRLLQYWPQISRHTWIAYYRNRLTFQACVALSETTTPLLLMRGENEPNVIAHTVAYVRQLHQATKVFHLPAGHDHPITCCTLWRAAIVQFFK